MAAGRQGPDGILSSAGPTDGTRAQLGCARVPKRRSSCLELDDMQGVGNVRRQYLYRLHQALSANMTETPAMLSVGRIAGISVLVMLSWFLL